MNDGKSLKGIIEKIKSNKILYYCLIAVIIIVLSLILTGNLFSTSAKTEGDEVIVYVDRLEKDLSELLSKVEGVGKVSVAISVESGMETVLASKVTTTEANGKIEKEESPIIINGKTVVLKELYPRIMGVLIVAEGANNISVRSKIQQATKSLLDINVNQIEILTMK